MDLILVVEGIKRSNLLNPKRASWNDWNGGLWGSNVFLFWGIIANWSDLAPGDDELLVQQGATAELHFDFDGLLFTVKRKRENSARRSCGNQEWRGELLLSRQGVWPCVKHVFFVVWKWNKTVSVHGRRDKIPGSREWEYWSPERFCYGNSMLVEVLHCTVL